MKGVGVYCLISKQLFTYLSLIIFMQKKLFQIKQILFWKRIFFAILCLSMASCAPNCIKYPCRPHHVKKPKPKSVIDIRKSSMALLKQKGVAIVFLGDEVLLVIPTSTLYPDRSPRLLPEAKREMNALAAFIGTFKKDAVFVKGFTNALGDPARNLSLSRQQAQNVADYLWWQGIDARMIVAEGRGSDDPISTNRTRLGRKQNQRIEILFRQITD